MKNSCLLKYLELSLLKLNYVKYAWHVWMKNIILERLKAVQNADFLTLAAVEERLNIVF